MLWGIKLTSQNLLDGYREEWAYQIIKGQFANLPALFVSREAARAYAKEKYGYIAKRQDLRREPHGWFSARVCKVTMAISEI